MLSPKTQTNLANAKGYFKEHLCAGDYYAETGRVQGVWMGEGAARLGLSGAVTRDAFVALCDNQHPVSGERLTQRHKTTRHDSATDSERANRRVFFDFTISPPKSVSIAALVANDTPSWKHIERQLESQSSSWSNSPPLDYVKAAQTPTGSLATSSPLISSTKLRVRSK